LSDIILNIKLTEIEVDLIRDALHAFEPQDTGWEQVDLSELSDDLLEQAARHDDGWNDAVPEAAAEFVQAGINAREQAKGTSRAAQRRQEQNERMMKGTATPTDPDTWPLNDPADW
jgi:hypothetical protein